MIKEILSERRIQVEKEKDEVIENEVSEKEAKEEKKKKKKTSKENEELERLKEEFEKYKEVHLRVLAEYDNFRKRSQNEKVMAYANATSDAVNAVLPVADNIERALGQENASAEDLVKGIEMIKNQFEGCFSKLGVTKIGEVGDKFNPDLHNAVSHIENEEFEENTVTEVFQKGYMLGDKVIRYAMVQVAN